MFLNIRHPTSYVGGLLIRNTALTSVDNWKIILSLDRKVQVLNSHCVEQFHT